MSEAKITDTEFCAGTRGETIRWTIPDDAAGEGFSPELFADATRFRVLGVLSAGAECVERAEVVLPNGEARELVVKTFPRANFFQRVFSEKRVGTKAQRAFRAAQILRELGVGTPRVIALAETFSASGAREESRLVSEFIPGLTNFRVEMHRLLRAGDDAVGAAALIQTVANACRAFHECGIIHRDLGNQNIALKKTPWNEWDVYFLDLDRVRIFPPGTLTPAQRGADLARLDLPSELRMFFHLYYDESSLTPEFSRAERKTREAFARHERTRKFRHPLREWKIHCAELKKNHAPALAPNEIWLWDERSVQAVPVLSARERRKYLPASNIFSTAKELLLRGNAVRRAYRETLKKSFSEPRENFSDGIGMTLEAEPASWTMQLGFLAQLEASAGAPLPILLRVYNHKGAAQREFVCEKARELHARGNAVAIALVQDRAAVREPAGWRETVRQTVGATHEFADFYEIGHATNRAKWGIWDFADYAKLLAPALEAKRAFPKIRLTGPSCIDFDLHSLPGILSRVPAGTFAALSQHLYVDRRGAPENFQGKFDLVAKCAWLRATAKIYGFAEEKIIVSEFNWPLLGTGTWSPIGAFYCSPGGPFASPPSVNEDDCAKFMCRYFLLALASGHVSRAYWWRLAHRAFGLIDDSVDGAPRERPAFSALKNLLENLRGARFEKRIFDGKDSADAARILEFSRRDGTRFRALWTKDSFPRFEEIEQ